MTTRAQGWLPAAVFGTLIIGVLTVFLAFQHTFSQPKENGKSESPVPHASSTIPEQETPPSPPAPSFSPKTIIKSVRLDLSSVPEPKDFDHFAEEVLNRVVDAGGNTVFISPWSDGSANYKSAVAPKSAFGKRGFVEEFLKKARALNVKVFAWFVVGKDDFPAKLHPEWFTKTAQGSPYYHEDEPGIRIPVASLANDDYRMYHLKLIREVNALPVDGWVISEPLVGWGDRYDPDYADFSEVATSKFTAQYGIKATPQLYKNELPPDLDGYSKWASFRAQTVTNFVRGTIQEIRSAGAKPVVITLFTEPDENGTLVSLGSLKEWLGMDIPALLALRPDYLEIQNLFLDFEFPQPPEWTSSMIQQFRRQLGADVPLMVSVQGFDSTQALTPQDFGTAVNATFQENVAGVSFYAYHTLKPGHWEMLKKIWGSQ